ncbi:hypothetical protein [uncultured Microbacterium sp.]|nr:hypothetical protein [uncultured Microbacterium sp.]
MMGNIGTEQPRTAAGKFDYKPFTPPEGSLTDESEGTFAFPPETFDTAAALAEFFESAPISDRILSNADHAFRKWREDRIVADLRRDYEAWGNDPRTVATAKRNPIEYHRQADAFSVTRRAEIEAQYPIHSISPVTLRKVLRARQIVVWRGLLPDAEEQAALDWPVTIAGVATTAADVTHRYSTAEWVERALTDSDLAAVDAMTLVTATLVDIDENGASR